MKTILLLLFFILGIESSLAESASVIDSIQVIGYKYGFETDHCIGRYEFLETLVDNNLSDSIDESECVNVIIKDRTVINQLMDILNNLTIIRSLTYSSNEVQLKAIYSRKDNQIFWIDQTTIDIRLCLVLFGKNIEFVWLNESCLEKGFYSYYLSEDLTKALSKYTHLFDNWGSYQPDNDEKFKIDGIYYELYEETKEARVVSGHPKYRGDIKVPPTIMHQGKKYVVTTVGDFAFSSDSITSIHLPSTVTSIGEYVCAGCFGLTSMVIPQGVKEIPDYSFNNCVSLTSINIPDGVTSIGKSAFSDCIKMASVRIPNSVITIGREAFDGCESLTSMTIPSSVMKISERAICRSLDTIMVDAGNPVYDSRVNCNAIIETSTNRLITGCRNTVIPDDVTSIGEFAFFRCESLMSITIPESVTLIDEHAFHGCGISSLIIPNKVDSIGDYAFVRCSKLSSVTLPAEISSIGSGAFMNCESLKEVYCFAEKAPLIVPRVFEGTPIENATLYVPEASVEEYKSADTWGRFKEIKPCIVPTNP